MVGRTYYFAGYYAIVDLTGNCVYVGATTNIYRRWSIHKRELNANKHKNKKLQKAWNEAKTKHAGLAIDNFAPYVKRTFFGFLSKRESKEDFLMPANACFVFIPIVMFQHDNNWSGAEEDAVQTELFAYEEGVSDCLQAVLDISSFNSWLKPGTDERVGAPVCIDGQFFKSKAEAARALTGGNESVVYRCLETKKYNKWCEVSGKMLIKRVRVQNSKGQRLGHKRWQYGEVLFGADNKPVAFYWENPQPLEDNPQGS